ncbi:MAG: LysR family transcriptional regulator [Natronohydrobacter sp.]|nr:LysR family transcriptional regulator [Natronohydrobacter sp.]
MNLKIRQLEIFRAVIELGSVTRAAERLNCTQPTVSIALSNLEAEIGFALFDRTGGHFLPTAEAHKVFEEVEQSLLSFERVKDRISELRNRSAGCVRVASHGAPSAYLLPEALSRFAASFPDVKMDVLVRSSLQVAQWVENRQVDFGILERPLARPASIVLDIDFPCVCLMPSDHPLTALKVIEIADLAKYRLIGVTKGHSVDDALDRAADANGVVMTRNICGYFFVTMRQLVASGIGIAVVDISNAVAGLGDGVVWRPLRPEILYEMSVVRSTTLQHSPVGDAFAASIEATTCQVMEKYRSVIASAET